MKKENKRPLLKQLIISEEDINKRIDQIEQLDCDDDLRTFLIDALNALVHLDYVVGLKNTTIARLKKIFNKTVEKSPKSGEKKERGTGPGRGNNKGRNGRDKFPKSPIIIHPIKDHSHGDCCPECGKGHLGDIKPGIYIRITGSAPLMAMQHQTEKLRCTACHKIYEANFEGKEEGRYNAEAKSLVVLFKYQLGLSFNKLARLQRTFLVPLPASTQWDLVEQVANVLWPIWNAMIMIAAQCNNLFMDDTKNRVLTLIKENKKAKETGSKKVRKGIFTTCIIAVTKDEERIVLFFTGRKYSGENLTKILEQRETSDVPVVMSDALNTNNIKSHEVLKALCLVHARRKFFDLDTMHSEEVEFIIGKLKTVFENDQDSKKLCHTPEKRLEYHQEFSAPPMLEIKDRIDKLIEDKVVEPNSSMGKSIAYMRNNWEGLTAFLKIPGAPIHNNDVEREIRTPVMNRKTTLFFKSEHGALINDIHLSIIKTCEGVGVSPHDYMNWVQKNAKEVRKDPSRFLPWKFTGNMGDAGPNSPPQSSS